jgi:hypothetical protein
MEDNMGKKDFESMSNVQKEPEFGILMKQAYDMFPENVIEQYGYIQKATRNPAYLYTWMAMQIQHIASLNHQIEITVNASQIDYLFSVLLNLAAKMDDTTTLGVYDYFHSTAGHTMERIFYSLAEQAEKK